MIFIFYNLIKHKSHSFIVLKIILHLSWYFFYTYVYAFLVFQIKNSIEFPFFSLNIQCEQSSYISKISKQSSRK